MFIDFYYLNNYNLSPKLPESLTEILELLSDQKLKYELIKIVVAFYEHIYDELLESDRPDWIPDLYLELAMGLVYLEDKTFARKLALKSLSKWLELRDSLPSQKSQDINAFLKNVDFSFHQSYAEQIYKCLDIAGEPKINLLGDVLENWRLKKIRGDLSTDSLGKILYGMG